MANSKSEELTARQLRRLLDARDGQLRDLREAYLAELRLLRGQLFGVRARGKQTLSIPFEVEPSLAAGGDQGTAPRGGLDPTRGMNSSQHHQGHPGGEPVDAATIKSVKNEFRALIARHTERRTVHVDVHMKEMQAQIEGAAQQIKFLQSRVEDLEGCGKAKLNRQVKNLRMRALRMGGESERRAEVLKKEVKKARAEKELAQRQMVTAQMSTKAAITAVADRVMKMCKSHERDMLQALDVMLARLNRCDGNFALMAARVTSYAGVGQIRSKSGYRSGLVDRWAENDQMKEVQVGSVKEIGVQTALLVPLLVESDVAAMVGDVISPLQNASMMGRIDSRGKGMRLDTRWDTARADGAGEATQNTSSPPRLDIYSDDEYSDGNDNDERANIETLRTFLSRFEEEGSAEEAVWERQQLPSSPRLRSRSVDTSPIFKHRKHVAAYRTKPGSTSQSSQRVSTSFISFQEKRPNSARARWRGRGQKTTMW
jgi:hypothetical protein